MKTFVCPRHTGNLTLSTDSCAALWLRAKKARYEPGSTIGICKGCDIGAQHAGRKNEPVVPVVAGCVRCHRASLRLVNNLTCISCYNRERELVQGRNARGCKPIHLAPLGPVSLAYRVGSRVSQVTLRRVSGMLEAELSVVRRLQQSVDFMRCSPVSGLRQLTLFGGV